MHVFRHMSVHTPVRLSMHPRRLACAQPWGQVRIEVRVGASLLLFVSRHISCCDIVGGLSY